MLHLEEDPALERLVRCALRYARASEQDCGSGSRERDVAKNCLLNAARQYAKVDESFARTISFDPALFAERHRDCLCGASVPEIADTCQRCGGLVLGAPLLPGRAPEPVCDCRGAGRRPPRIHNPSCPTLTGRRVPAKRAALICTKCGARDDDPTRSSYCWDRDANVANGYHFFGAAVSVKDGL